MILSRAARSAPKTVRIPLPAASVHFHKAAPDFTPEIRGGVLAPCKQVPNQEVAEISGWGRWCRVR